MLKRFLVCNIFFVFILSGTITHAAKDVFFMRENFTIKMNCVWQYIADPIFTVDGSTYLSENDICSLFHEMNDLIERQYVSVCVDEMNNMTSGFAIETFEKDNDFMQIEILKIGSVSYYPLRKIAELFDSKVEWFEEEQEIQIISQNPDNCYIPFGDKNGEYGYMLNNGEILIEPQFFSANNFSNGIASVSVVGKGRYNEGCIDKNGVIVIEPKYKGIGKYDGEILDVRDSSERCQYITLDGMVMAEYNGGRSFYEGYAVVRTKGYANAAPTVKQKWSYMNKNMQIVSKEFDKASNFVDGYAVVKEGKNYSILDRAFNTITELKDIYSSVSNIGENRFIVGNSDSYGIIDLFGNVIVPLIYENLCASGEGLIAAQKDGFFGYIDYNGNMMIPFQFDHVSAFSDGVAVVTKSEQNGVIDRNGNYILPLTSSESYEESNLGVISVYDTNQLQICKRYVNTYGLEIFPH